MKHKKRTRANHPGTAARVGRNTLMPAMLAATMSCTSAVWAVEGGVVAAGSGTINTQGSKTTISQASDKMIVNWKNFDIGKNQAVNVSQPGATSALLNRVTTASPTQIDGALTANGRVFVVNPAGVVFGKSAKVDVGSLVASALDVTDQQFMDGGKQGLNGSRYLNLYSRGAEGKVTNNGQLTAKESVILLGRQAINQGSIKAKDVTLGAADGVAMSMNDSGFTVMLGRAAQNALAANYGVIAAQGGNATLSAAATGAMLATVVQNTGVIEATRASSGEGGVVTLGSELDGKISAGGQLTADKRIEIMSSPTNYSDSPFDRSTMPFSGDYASIGHDVTVESGAKLNAANGLVHVATLGGDVINNGRINAGGVYLESSEGAVATNGRIDANTVKLEGGNVDINAPIRAMDSVDVHAGKMIQRANVSASNGSIKLVSAGDLIQADGVNTTAGTNVTLKSVALANPYTQPMAGGQIHVANVTAKTINIDGGDVTLAGKLKADGDISVQSGLSATRCEAEQLCIQSVQGGHLVQTGVAISRSGNVAMKASSSISQQAGSLTKAGNDVTLGAFDVQTGRVQAHNRIVVEAHVARLGGKLTASEISLPDNTLNTDGNIRIKPKATDL
ncbi:hypothetical protein LMG28727_06453 [Paraburkholderia kirstenboschensis]|uniref:filamentous hemagglutinin N-terminal domain-containing protein n=1 Tax=Paraburkholderia kirstenboschensis TaxID=1245436 RepID=UPI000FFC31F5|nr:filamentous hemagglutinin N-terminal domain-containing protein [Paraburkholderia kirstenboschensis]CAD6557834.1 hypothetical protein LMG28727_06453 [Paraburkholderia kirstenboschensis]